MPNHIGFALIHSQGTESVSQALWDATGKAVLATVLKAIEVKIHIFLNWPPIFQNSWKQNNIMLWVLAAYAYTSISSKSSGFKEN